MKPWREITKPTGRVLMVPPSQMPPGRKAHEEIEIDGVRVVADWFWAPDEGRIVMRFVNMRTGAVVWVEPVKASQ